VKPSHFVVIQGDLSQSNGLNVAVDVDRSIRFAVNAETPVDMYNDESVEKSTNNLHAVLGTLPMFADELLLVEQAMVDFDNAIEKSPMSIQK
jgi:hypothetical protein